MSDKKLLEQREEFAEHTLVVAKKSLEKLEEQIDEAPAKELVQVFNAAIKAYRYLTSEEFYDSSAEDQDSLRDIKKKSQPVMKKSEQLLASLM